MTHRRSWTSLLVALATCTMTTVAAAQEPTPEPAPTPWRVDARLRPRTEFRYNQMFNLDPTSARYQRVDNQDALSLQSRLGVGYESGPVAAQLQLQHAAIWGTTGGDELTDPALGIHQAFVRWTPVELWWLQVGRFEVAYGDQRVLGSVGWSQTGRAWDGLRTGLSFTDDIGLDLLGLVYQDGLLQGASGYAGRVFEDDSVLTGLYFHSTKLSTFLTDVDVYALGDLQFDQLADAPQRQLLGTFGTRLRAAVDPASLVVEGAYQAGERCVPVPPADPRLPPTMDCTPQTVSVSAGFFDSELTFVFGKVKPFVGFGMATGDNPDTTTNEAYFHMYPTAHKFLGLMDVIGARTNVREARIGASLAIDKLSIKESLHHFTALRPRELAVGVEADTSVSYVVADVLDAQVGHALFVPLDGVAIDGTSPNGVANWWYLQLVFHAGTNL